MAGRGDPAPNRNPAQPAAMRQDGLSSIAKFGVAVVTTLLVIWFFIAWLALDRHILDAAGEAVGSAFALLVVVSVIGAVRGSRD